MALVASAVGFQPEMVPSSVANMNRAGLLGGGPGVSKKSVATGLKTLPVGTPCVPPPAPGGIVTTSENATPSPLYTVATPVPLSATHMGLVPLRAIPHPLTRFASVCKAGTAVGSFETREVTW